MKKISILFAVLFTVFSMRAQEVYTLVESVNDLEAGQKVVLIGFDKEGNAFAMGYQKSNNRHAIQVDENGGSVELTVASNKDDQTSAFELTVGGSNGAWTFYDELNNGYLYAASSTSNYLKTQATLNDNGKWNITMDADGGATPVAQGANTRNVMHYNEGSTLFGAYSPTGTVNGLVYIYAQGGEIIIDPEPSNYPEDFYAKATGNNIRLSWLDLGGAQLPKKYLILGSTGTIVPPVDGVPVENNINVEKGEFAMNVVYGKEDYTFTDLKSLTTYNFAIFPYTNGGENIDYKTDAPYPTASATTEEVATLLSEDFNGSLGQFTAYNIYGDQVWGYGSYYEQTYARMSGYASEANHENEDWLVSPKLSFDYEAVVLSFVSAMKFDGPQIEVVISFEYEDGSDPTQYEWYVLNDYFEFSTGDYTFVNSGNVDLREIFANKGANTFHIAFVYTSTDEAATTWEIGTVRVYGGQHGLAIDENEAADAFVVTPNPTSSYINFVAEKTCESQIFDAMGREVMNFVVVEGQNRINVESLNSGVYFVKMNNNTVRFIKY